MVSVLLKVEVGNRQRGWVSFKTEHYPNYLPGQEIMLATELDDEVIQFEHFRVKEVAHSVGPEELPDDPRPITVNVLVEVTDRKQVRGEEEEGRFQDFMLTPEEKDEIFENESFDYE
ncbi:hypothetical protein GCM10027347_61610 [Larkinella harenae]